MGSLSKWSMGCIMKSCFSLFKPCCVFMALYVSVIVAYGFYSYNSNKKETLRNIDETLSLVATGVKRSLAADFNDRAKSKDAISDDESHLNTLALTDYAKKTSVLRVYTMVKSGDTIFYTSLSQVSEEIKNKLIPPFYLSYNEAPKEVYEAFDKLNATYISETTKWGSLRKVLLPEISPNGKRYLSGVELCTKQIDAKLKKHLWASIGISSLFILLVIPFVFLFKKTEKERIEEFESLKDLLHQRSMDRTTRIERKINEYIDKK